MPGYCHEEFADAAPPPCPGCGTLLHAACRVEAARCPTLGCAEGDPPRARRVIRLAPPPPGSDPGASAFSGGVLAAVWIAASAVIPSFERIFAEIGVPHAGCTHHLLSVPPWGWATLSALSVAVFLLKDHWLGPIWRARTNAWAWPAAGLLALAMAWSLFFTLLLPLPTRL